MESIINDYISRELVSKPELLPLHHDTQLIETGILDSLTLLRLMLFLEEEFSVETDGVEFIPENFYTIDAICSYIRTQRAEQLPS